MRGVGGGEQRRVETSGEILQELVLVKNLQNEGSETTDAAGESDDLSGRWVSRLQSDPAGQERSRQKLQSRPTGLQPQFACSSISGYQASFAFASKHRLGDS